MIWLKVLLGGFMSVLLLLCFFKIRGRILHYQCLTVASSRLPKSFDGFKIVLISDLHDRVFGKDNGELSRKILKAKPDIVVMAGDMHEGEHDPTPFYRLISDLSKKVPVYYTEGNHDSRPGKHRSREAFRAENHRNIVASGGVVLNDTVDALVRNGEMILLYGQGWQASVEKKDPRLDLSSFCLMVCHDPMRFDSLSPLPDVLLSGHVHGGLIRLPFVGAVFAPGCGAPIRKRFALKYFFPKYSHGRYQKDGCSLVVSQGLGFSVLPLRILRPEVLVLTLRAEK